MKHLHLISGVVFLLIFLLTGQYMARVLQLPEQPLDAQRMMYRAAHIYLLFAALLNIMTGIYWQQHQRIKRLLQAFASICILLAQPTLLIAFWQVPQHAQGERGVTLFACLLSLAGVVVNLTIYLHTQLISKWRTKAQ